MKAKAKALQSAKSKTSELISGQCENCGNEYRQRHNMRGDPTCKGCGKKSQNWDTVHGSQMAPSMVRITK